MPISRAMRHCDPAAHCRGGSHLSSLADAKGITHGSLADEHPDLASQWVPESNGSQTPESVSAGSQFRATWRCGKECEHCGEPHEWSAEVRARSLAGRGCPLCSGNKVCRCRSLAAMHPELMKQWDRESNQGDDPYSIGCSSGKRVSWTCTEHGQWDAPPKDRIRSDTGCPECARHQRLGNSPQPKEYLKDEMPAVYAELHPNKNSGIDIESLTCGSGKRVWWLCQSNLSRPEGCQHEHEWEARVDGRCRSRRPSGCPFCSGSRVCPCNSLAVLQPTLMQYWDFVRNAIPLQEPLDPLQIAQYSKRKVWWRHECPDGQVHHWRTCPNVLTSNSLRGRVPCPGCAAAARAAASAERTQAAGHRRLIKRT